MAYNGQIDNLARDENAGRETAGCVRDGERLRVVSDEHIGYRICKRCFDLVISLAAGIVLLIPMLLLMALIVIKDPGCPLYFHERVGKGGRQIHVAKLRTMRKGADDLQAALTPEQIKEYRREYKIEDDPRLIGWKKPGDGKRCFGAKLRQLSLDEMPQIYWNVLIKGDMSIVGPRPILWSELEENYTPEQRAALLAVKPGVTGYWQAYARNDAKYGAGGGKATDGDVLSRASKPGLRSENHIRDDAVGAAAQRDVSSPSLIRRTPGKSYFFFKRCFDLLFSLLCLILLSPLFLLIAICIRREDGGPIIYRRRCVSANGHYDMLKFRTMVTGASDLEKYLTVEQIEEYHTNVKLKDDPRITKIGHILRKTSLDELPQLVNILRGEMTFVGPRPVVQEELEFFGSKSARLLTAKPGITGYWQVHGRSDNTYESGDRQRLDLYYVEHRSIWMDIVILFQTIPAVLSSHGSY